MIRHWVDAIGDTTRSTSTRTRPRHRARRASSPRRRCCRRGRCAASAPAPHAAGRAGRTDGAARRARASRRSWRRTATRSTCATCAPVTTSRPRRIIESVSEEKATGLGVGHFVTTRQEYRDQDGELVGTMRFRILKFRPGPRRGAEAGREPPAAAARDHPRQRLLVRGREGRASCSSSGARRAGCCATRPGRCARRASSLEWDTVEASGARHRLQLRRQPLPAGPGVRLPARDRR